MKKRNIYLYPLAATIILRICAIPLVDASKPAFMEYGIIARNLLSGSGYSYSWIHTDGSAAIRPTAYMPPGQVLIQYGFFGVFGDSDAGMIALYLFQIIQACVFIYLIGKITDLIFKSEKVTSTTIWLAALYPPFIYMTMTFGVTSSALVLNTLVLYLAFRFSEALRMGNHYLKYSLLLGASCGVLLLFRGESPVIIMMTLALIAYLNRVRLRRTLFYTGAAAFMAIAILTPWTIRNYLIFDRFIPISTNGGFNFWRGNNSLTTGSPWAENGDPIWSSDQISAEIEPYLDKEGDFDKISADIHTREALRWIRENPTQFALLSMKKAVIFWTFDLRSKMGGTFAYIALYSCALAGLVTGIFFIRKNKITRGNENARIGLRIMILWCALMTLISMIFFPLPRFQILLIGIYFPVIGYGVSEIRLRLASTRRAGSR